MQLNDSIRVSVIGHIGVVVPDAGFRRLQPAQRQLLSLLVAAGPQGLTADQLADEIWPERLPNRWQASVRMTVSRLRRSVGTNFVDMVDGYYRLSLGVDQVDAWYLNELTERSTINLTAGDVDRLGDFLGPVEIYGGVETTLTIEASIREIESAQRMLIAAAANRRIELPRSVLRQLYRRVLAAPYEESLCADIALLHALAGSAAAAQELIDETRREILGSYGVEVSDDLLALERKIAGGSFHRQDPSLEPDEAAPELRAAPAVLPVALQVPVDEPVLRAEAAGALAEILATDRAIVLLTGPAGAGSIRLISRALSRTKRTLGTILYGQCSEGVSLAYEPFLEFLPELRATVARGETQDVTAVWSAVAEELSTLSKGQPITLVIGRAQEIDSSSLDLVGFLARSQLQFPLRMVLSGRNDIERPEFGRLERLLSPLENVHRITIDPLTVDEVAIMVAATFPHAASAVLRSLSEEIQVRSGGLPTVVGAIIETLDPTTLRLPASGTGQSHDVFHQLVANLSVKARSVGVAAAVLGRDASLNDLELMTELDSDVLLDVIEELLDTGLLVETAGVDRLSFAHQLAMDEFIQQTRDIRLRQMHMKARNLTDDPHRRARHDLLAWPTVPSAEVRSSQLRSARLLHGQGSYRAAAAAFREAQAVEPDIPLGVPDGIAYADAVSRTGALAEATELRSKVIARCIAEGNWDGVLGAAIVGLPEAELLDGDPERFAQLSSIPADRLSPLRRFDLAVHLTRQAALLGREEVSRVWVNRAGEWARTPDQQAQVAIAWRMANDVAEPALTRLARVEEALKLRLDHEDRLSLLLVCALDRYQTGRIDDALEAIEELSSIAERIAHPMRIWHAGLFTSMHLFTIGAWDEARAAADETHSHGQRFGITVATPTRMAQEFFAMWIAGQHGGLVPLLDATPPDDASSLLFQAAHAVALHADDQAGRAQRKATTVARRFLSAPAAHGMASMALLAPVLAESEDRELVDQVAGTLRTHVGSGLIIGAGVANMGPVGRYLAQLEGESDAATAASIVATADRLNMPLWRLISRSDLHKLDPAAVAPGEMVQIAAGTAMESLL